jgi:hypothetical protein
MFTRLLVSRAGERQDSKACALRVGTGATVVMHPNSTSKTGSGNFQQRCFQFRESGQEFIGLNNVALSVFVRSDNSAPTLRRASVSILKCPTGSDELVSEVLSRE